MHKKSFILAYLLSVIPFTQIIQIKYIPIFLGSAIISLDSIRVNAENILLMDGINANYIFISLDTFVFYISSVVSK